MSLVDDAFTSLFYGEGAYFGLILLTIMMVGFAAKWKYAGAVFFPIAVVLAIEYLTRNLIWCSIVMMFNCVFIILLIWKKGGEK